MKNVKEVYPLVDKKRSPRITRAIPIIFPLPGIFFSIIIWKKGVKIINVPVINPDFVAEV